jgi:predicted nucleic acid-binding protein
VDGTLRSTNAIHVQLGPIRRVFRDPADDYLLATALAGGARYVVSADHDVLAVDKYSGIRMVSAKELLAIIRR